MCRDCDFGGAPELQSEMRGGARIQAVGKTGDGDCARITCVHVSERREWAGESDFCPLAQMLPEL